MPSRAVSTSEVATIIRPIWVTAIYGPSTRTVAASGLIGRPQAAPVVRLLIRLINSASISQAAGQAVGRVAATSRGHRFWCLLSSTIARPSY